MCPPQVIVLDLLDHKPLITSGYTCILHAHTLSIECAITKMVSELDRTTSEKSKKRPKFLKSGSVGNIIIQVWRREERERGCVGVGGCVVSVRGVY